jgi:hypothetical protein
MSTSSPWLAISTNLGNSAWLLDNVAVMADLYYISAQRASTPWQPNAASSATGNSWEGTLFSSLNLNLF